MKEWNDNDNGMKEEEKVNACKVNTKSVDHLIIKNWLSLVVCFWDIKNLFSPAGCDDTRKGRDRNKTTFTSENMVNLFDLIDWRLVFVRNKNDNPITFY